MSATDLEALNAKVEAIRCDYDAEVRKSYSFRHRYDALTRALAEVLWFDLGTESKPKTASDFAAAVADLRNRCEQAECDAARWKKQAQYFEGHWRALGRPAPDKQPETLSQAIDAAVREAAALEAGLSR